MRPAVRVGLVVVGAAMAVYGAASCTGGWLGTPPWWERAASATETWDVLARWALEVGTEPRRREGEPAGEALRPPLAPVERGPVAGVASPIRVPRAGRAAISGAVAAVGLALVAGGAWPRRRRSNP